jgi:PAS domain S-box-containing protein
MDPFLQLRKDLSALLIIPVIVQVLFIGTVMVLLYLTSTYNYLLFHSIVELAGIAVAFCIFIIVWNTRQNIEDAFFLIVGMSFLFIGGIDLLHVLSFKGMGVFAGNDADLPTQLWIAARYLQCATFLIATFYIGRTISKNRKYDAGIILAACTAASGIILSSIFVWQDFPACFIEGVGLTPFKIASEYIICAILIATIIILYLKREHFDPSVWKLLIAAQVCLVLGELTFTSYVSVFGFTNMLGHLFRLLSVYFFYRVFVVISLTRPYDLILHKLGDDEHRLQESEKKYRTLFENMLEGFAYCRMIYNAAGQPVDWEYLDVNKAFGRLTGLENAAGKRVLEIIPDIRELTPDLFDTYGRVARTGIPETFEIDFKPLRIWLKVSVFSPEKGFFVAVFWDITKRKTAEESLQAKTDVLDRFFSVALDLLCIADTEGYFRTLNSAWETTLGYSREELMAHRFLDFVHPDDVEATLNAIASLKDQKEVINFVNRYRCKDGSYRWIEWKSYPYGNVIYAAARDITGRKQAEDELRNARDFYLKILDDFPNPVWRAAISGKCDYFNRAWLEFTGRTIDEEFGDGWAEGVHPDDLDRCLKIYLEHFNSRTPFEMEYRLRYHDGTYRWLYDSGKPFFTPDGEFSGYIGSCYDITDRRQAEEALRETRDYLENLLDYANAPIIVWDREFRISRFNHAFENLTGIRQADVIGKNLEILFPEATKEESLTKIHQTSIGERWESVEIPILHSSGETRIVLWNSAAIYDPAGNIISTIAQGQDITGRKRAEEALKESEEKFRDIFNNANDGIEIHEVDASGLPGKYIDVNDVGCRMLNYTREELLALSPLDIVSDYHDRPLEEIGNDIITKGSARFETEHRRKDGTIVPVEINAHVIRLRGQDVVVAIVRDITERKRVEDALQQVNKKLNLLSSITRHDINNQLLTLKGFLELSKDTLGNAAQTSEYLIRIERAANAIERQIVFTKEYQDLGVKAPLWQPVKACVQRVQVSLPMRNIQMVMDLPDIEVYADPLLEKVFYNLIDNALRYGGPGMTTIRIGSEESGKGLFISLEDDGTGISPEDKKRLFERGFGHHTGLGLFLSREILSITGMTITETSETGMGARFGIFIPKGAYRVR